MAKPYSMDLRTRVVAAVMDNGMSCDASAAHLGVSASSAIKWVRRVRETGSAAPGQMGGHKRGILSGPSREWLLERTGKDFTLRSLVPADISPPVIMHLAMANQCPNMNYTPFPVVNPAAPNGIMIATTCG